jgi:hypothetical protein
MASVKSNLKDQTIIYGRKTQKHPPDPHYLATPIIWDNLQKQKKNYIKHPLRKQLVHTVEF